MPQTMASNPQPILSMFSFKISVSIIVLPFTPIDEIPKKKIHSVIEDPTGF
jgi:hypothetical protein